MRAEEKAEVWQPRFDPDWLDAFNCSTHKCPHTCGCVNRWWVATSILYRKLMFLGIDARTPNEFVYGKG